ncbi:hypothetical protein NOVOSPHI9U_260235 [Novosphingobium sp. 9U]|nr:hypothetical protein NOVOSPHI9U_260235 [Novosphingobium sp. 9U]
MRKLRVRPPISSAASSTITSQSAFCSRYAAASPANPDPMTTAFIVACSARDHFGIGVGVDAALHRPDHQHRGQREPAAERADRDPDAEQATPGEGTGVEEEQQLVGQQHEEQPKRGPAGPAREHRIAAAVAQRGDCHAQLQRPEDRGAADQLHPCPVVEHVDDVGRTLGPVGGDEPEDCRVERQNDVADATHHHRIGEDAGLALNSGDILREDGGERRAHGRTDHQEHHADADVSDLALVDRSDLRHAGGRVMRRQEAGDQRPAEQQHAHIPEAAPGAEDLDAPARRLAHHHNRPPCGALAEPLLTFLVLSPGNDIWFVSELDCRWQAVWMFVLDIGAFE